MAKLRVTNKAVEDLDSIWNYTLKTWSERQADEYYEMLVSFCRKALFFKAFPFRHYDEVAQDLYGIKAGHHIIFYKRLINDDVLIVRILHERMDIQQHISPLMR